MTDLTPWLLAAVAALILTGGWLVAWTATHRDEPTTDIRWDDTDTMLLPAVSEHAWWQPEPLPWPDPDGWSAEVGWNAWTEWLRVTNEAWLDADALVFDALHAEWAPRLAIEPRRQLELEGAPA